MRRSMPVVRPDARLIRLTAVTCFVSHIRLTHMSVKADTDVQTGNGRPEPGRRNSLAG